MRETFLRWQESLDSAVYVVWLLVLRWFWFGPTGAEPGRLRVSGFYIPTATTDQREVQQRYIEAGVEFAGIAYMLDCACKGEVVLGVRAAYLKWLALEEEYIEHGFRPLRFEVFDRFVRMVLPYGVGEYRGWFEWPRMFAARFERERWSPLSVRHLGGI